MKHKILPRLGCLVAVTAAVGWLRLTGSLAAQSEGGESEPTDPIAVALAEVQQRLQQVLSNETLEAELKNRLKEAYQAAQGHYQSAQKSLLLESSFKDSIEAAPGETQTFRTQLLELGETVTTNAVRNAVSQQNDLEQVEQQWASEKGELTAWNNQLGPLVDRLNQQKLRPDAIRDQKSLIATALGEIETALSKEAPEGDLFNPMVAERAVLQARKVARMADQAQLEQELISHPLRLERTTAERDLMIKQIANATVLVAVLEERVIQLRRDDAKAQQEAAEAAEQELADEHLLVKRLAEENARLTREHAGLQTRIDEDLKQELVALKAKAAEVKSNFDRAREQINLVGLSESLAVLLLDQWRRLPDVRTNRNALSQRKTTIGELGLIRFQTEETLLQLPDSAQIDAVQVWAGEAYPAALEEEADSAVDWTRVSELVDSKKRVLGLLVADYDRLLQELGELDFEENKHISLVEEYTVFLEERLLWIPSASRVGQKTVGEVSDSIRWILSESNRREAVRIVSTFPRERPVFFGFLGLLLLVSIGFRPLVRRKERAYKLGVKRITTDSYGITLRAALLLLLQSAPFAAVLAFMGLHLMERESSVELFQGLGGALLYTAIHVFGILVLMNVCRPNGLGQAHFRWEGKIANRVGRQLLWFMPIAIITTLIVDLSEELGDEFHRSGLGRVALMGLLLAVAAIVSQTFRPSDGVLSGLLKRSPNGWLRRLQGLWFWGMVLSPIALAILAALGYQHTAVQLMRRTAITISFMVGAFVIHQLIWRWFIVKERKLQLEKIIERRRASGTAKAGGKEDSVSMPEINEDELDLKSLNEQTRKLLSSIMSFSLLLGLWLIWSDVLPALNILNSVELWQTETIVDGNSSTVPVTLNHLALSIIILLLASVAVRNISGFLEIGVLQNLPITAGSRYAIVSVVQYGIALFGAVMVFNVLGFSLAQFGWMMAALSVGLGFGLQEVVANFVSGVILLAERPIRVGDIVTVSDISGIVTRIRIRATTITNWDRQELVVPNKEFITGRILNWTLSNTVNRIVIVVGVAYGTDTERARKLLLKTATEHRLIMKDPGPLATFEGFDDSTLRLVLRCYLPNLDNRLSVITELHTEIDRAFTRAGIEISFPQRDLHVRSAPPELFKSQERPTSGPGSGAS